MKKYINISLVYAVAALAAGVFYREFTKLSGFTGVTVLGKVHPHLFLLGMLIFMLVALFTTHRDLARFKTFKAFLWTYNIGVVLTAVMMGGGVWLRSSGLVPDVFIAVFYTGLGIALAMAGVLFWIAFFRFTSENAPRSRAEKL